MFLQLTLLAAALTVAESARCVELDYYLPADAEHRSEVPSPGGYLGFQIGERHVEHAQLTGYLQHLAATSDRVASIEYGRSHGGRPLLLLIITSPENHARIEEIRQQHLRQLEPESLDSDAGLEAETDELPIVVNMGYGVHGDEPSASNAASLVAYHLAASSNEKVEQLLRRTIILLDPCLNPDGFERFAHWANNHRGQVANSDPNHREHRQGWPTGRTNYYWFDLNRDWLPAQHPESRGRLEQYHRWMPHMLLDYHEMGTGSSYFFQPGVPARYHPRIPEATRQLTEAIGAFHARALDEIGSLYFTRERFDDFYPGKGSTYPDLHGGIGILFEQASSRGHVQEGKWGDLTFEFTIRNHVRTSLSSLEAADELRAELQANLRAFYRESRELARHADVQGYLFTAPGDPVRLHEFGRILALHQIRGHILAEDVTLAGQTYPAGESLVVPSRQAEYRFLRTLFDHQTDFDDNIFYDVSAWTLAAAFNLQWAELEAPPPDVWLGDLLGEQPFPAQSWEPDENDFAYLLDYRAYYAPRALYRLLDAGVEVGVAEKPLKIAGEASCFERGTIIIPLGVQPDRRDSILSLLQQAAMEDGVPVIAARSGWSRSGIDLGSDSIRHLSRPRILLVVGGQVNEREAGEIWHLLDERFAIPVTLGDADRFPRIISADYTHIVMPSGNYSDWGDSTTDALRRWVRDGGTLVAQGSAIRWLRSNRLAEVAERRGEEPTTSDDNRSAVPASLGTEPGTLRRPFAEAERDRALRLLSGAIFRVEIDTTHPLGYGYVDDQIYVFRNQRLFLEPAPNVYSTPVAYPGREMNAGQFAGYVPKSHLDQLAGSASVLVHQQGSGRIILMVDNPSFRGFWYGTNRLLLNSIFFGSLIHEPRGD